MTNDNEPKILQFDISRKLAEEYLERENETATEKRMRELGLKLIEGEVG
jgi:hypothetical protein